MARRCISLRWRADFWFLLGCLKKVAIIIVVASPSYFLCVLLSQLSLLPNAFFPLPYESITTIPAPEDVIPTPRESATSLGFQPTFSAGLPKLSRLLLLPPSLPLVDHK